MDIYNSSIPNLLIWNKQKIKAITFMGITWYNNTFLNVPVRLIIHHRCHQRQWRKYFFIGYIYFYFYDWIRTGVPGARFECCATMAERTKGYTCLD